MTTLKIECQYYENYNVGPEGFNTYGDGQPHWKPKGGHTFAIRDFDPDFLFYDEEATIKAIHALVASKANEACKFEYISHELIFAEPEIVELNEFLGLYNETIAQ
jgi:hypothetical protein